VLLTIFFFFFLNEEMFQKYINPEEKTVFFISSNSKLIYIGGSKFRTIFYRLLVCLLLVHTTFIVFCLSNYVGRAQVHNIFTYVHPLLFIAFKKNYYPITQRDSTSRPISPQAETIPLDNCETAGLTWQSDRLPMRVSKVCILMVGAH
jgi:hypothetical protein